MFFAPSFTSILAPIGKAIGELGKVAVCTATEAVKNIPVKEIVTTAATEVAKDYINSYNNNREIGYSMLDSASNAVCNTVDKYSYDIVGTSLMDDNDYENDSRSQIPAIYYVNMRGTPINVGPYYKVELPR